MPMHHFDRLQVPDREATGIPPAGVPATVRPVQGGRDVSRTTSQRKTKSCQEEIDRRAIEQGENEGMAVHPGNRLPPAEQKGS